MNPSLSGVMIGLGSGIGAIQLLANFRHMDLTVVDIDPVVVNEAIKAFPLLEYYMDQGRLQIIIKDAQEYLLEANDVFDCGFLDAYTGKDNTLNTDCLDILRVRCKDIYINNIDEAKLHKTIPILKFFHDAGLPIRHMFRAVPPDLADFHVTICNWILTTQAVDVRALDSFVPFADINTRSAKWAISTWLGVIKSETTL
jgi:hypothetical protein